MKEWEYKTVNLGCFFNTGKGNENMLQRKCSELGKEGWELVNFQNYDLSTKFMMIFKREIE